MTTTQTKSILAYCAACNDDKAFHPETRTETMAVRGTEVSAEVDVLVCPDCGEVRDAPGFDSMLAFYNAYRQRHGYLMPHEIVALRERYDLSREAFASLLGMSPASLYRYEGGGLQDKVHDIALRSCQDPSQMVELVRRNPESLTARQMQKFQAAIDRTCNMLTILICRILQLAGPTYRTKLNKLLFYTDFLAYDLHGNTISGARYRAIQFGPVPTHYDDHLTEMEMRELIEHLQLDDDISNYGQVALKRMPEGLALSAEHDLIVQHVVEYFKGWTATRISNYSHLEDAWEKTPKPQIIDLQHAKTLKIPRPTLPQG